ncbi:MAG: hypothetical protein ACK5O8_04845 [Pirellula sp.]
MDIPKEWTSPGHGRPEGMDVPKEWMSPRHGRPEGIAVPGIRRNHSK